MLAKIVVLPGDKPRLDRVCRHQSSSFLPLILEKISDVKIIVLIVPNMITTRILSNCISSSWRCMTTPTPIGTKSKDRYPRSFSDVLMISVRSGARILSFFEFIIINVKSINISPRTGPGIAKSKYFCRTSPISCKTRIVKIAVSKNFLQLPSNEYSVGHYDA